MSLFFHILFHILISFAAGFIVYYLWKRPILSVFSALVGGVVIDFDHFFDYFQAFGLSFNLAYFANGYQYIKNDQIFLFLHAWEFGLILLILVFILKNPASKTILLGLALGLLFHLTTDIYLNGISFKFYSLSYRIKNNFAIEKIVPEKIYQQHLDRKQSILLE